MQQSTNHHGSYHILLTDIQSIQQSRRINENLLTQLSLAFVYGIFYSLTFWRSLFCGTTITDASATWLSSPREKCERSTHKHVVKFPQGVLSLPRLFCGGSDLMMFSLLGALLTVRNFSCVRDAKKLPPAEKVDKPLLRFFPPIENSLFARTCDHVRNSVELPTCFISSHHLSIKSPPNIV